MMAFIRALWEVAPTIGLRGAKVSFDLLFGHWRVKNGFPRLKPVYVYKSTSVQ